MPDEITPLRSGHLTVGDQKIWWEYHGTGDREVVALLNGLAMHTRAWYGFLPLLSDGWDVILFDYQGQGQSSKDDIPYFIPDFARYLSMILDENDVEKIHVMGISYGGFIGLEFARLFQERTHTLCLSGILASHEKLFSMYQAISLRFYRGTRNEFELYTHYMYEKIFGEAFVAKLSDADLDAMRQRFFERYVDHRHCLIRLTEAQNPFFGALEENMAGYRAIETPTIMIAGSQDRAIPLWQQKKICGILPNSRWIEIEGAGHVVYLERPDVFFPMLRAFMAAGSVEFEGVGGRG
jgi:3-oxoadipate enol-lactonase